MKAVVVREIRVLRGASFPLERASEAHRAIEERHTTSKVLLTVGDAAEQEIT